MSEKGIITSMREMEKGQKLTWPIRSITTTRNSVALLNTIHFNEGKKWKSEAFKEKGVVEVERVE